MQDSLSLERELIGPTALGSPGVSTIYGGGLRATIASGFSLRSPMTNLL